MTELTKKYRVVCFEDGDVDDSLLDDIDIGPTSYVTRDLGVPQGEITDLSEARRQFNEAVVNADDVPVVLYECDEAGAWKQLDSAQGKWDRESNPGANYVEPIVV